MKKIDDTTIEITELPVRKWTQDYKEMLEEWVNGTDKVPATLKDYEEHHTDTTVHFRIHMSEKEMKAAEADGLEKRFKISTQISTSNMVCFDLNGKIRKYSSPEEILSDFFHKRVEYYGLRKVCHDMLVLQLLMSYSNTSPTSSHGNLIVCRIRHALCR